MGRLCTGAAGRAAQRAFRAVERSSGSGGPASSIPTAGSRGAAPWSTHASRKGAAAFPALCAAVVGLAGAGASISSILDLGGGTSVTLAVGIAGRRYCHNVGREHKSNGVYWIVRAATGDAVLRCHDPDCSGKQSRPFALPREALQELGVSSAVPSSPTLHAPAAMARDLNEANHLAREEFCRRRTLFVPTAAATPNASSE